MPPLCHLHCSHLNGVELRTPPAAVFKIGFALDVQNEGSGDDGSWGPERGAERWAGGDVTLGGLWGSVTGEAMAGRVDIG